MMGSVDLYNYTTADSVHSTHARDRQWWKLGKTPPSSKSSGPVDYTDCIGSAQVPESSKEIYLYHYPRSSACSAYDTGYRNTKNYRNFVATTTSSSSAGTPTNSCPKSLDVDELNTCGEQPTDSEKSPSTPTSPTPKHVTTKSVKHISTKGLLSDPDGDLKLNRLIVNQCIDSGKKLIEEGKKTEEDKLADQEQFESQLRRTHFYNKLPSQKAMSLSSIGSPRDFDDGGQGYSREVKVTTRMRSTGGPSSSVSRIRQQVKDEVVPAENEMPVTWRYYTARDPLTNTWRTGRRPAKDIEFADKELDNIKSREDVLYHRQNRRPRYSRNHTSTGYTGSSYLDVMSHIPNYRPLSSGYNKYGLNYGTIYNPTHSAMYSEVVVDDDDYLHQSDPWPSDPQNPVVVVRQTEPTRTEHSLRSEEYHLDADIMEDKHEGLLAIEGPKRADTVSIPVHMGQHGQANLQDATEDDNKGKNIPISIIRENGLDDASGVKSEREIASTYDVLNGTSDDIWATSKRQPLEASNTFKEKVLTPKRVWSSAREPDKEEKDTSKSFQKLDLKSDEDDYETQTDKLVKVSGFQDSYTTVEEVKSDKDGNQVVTSRTQSSSFKPLRASKEVSKEISKDVSKTDSGPIKKKVSSFQPVKSSTRSRDIKIGIKKNEDTVSSKDARKQLDFSSKPQSSSTFKSFRSSETAVKEPSSSFKRLGSIDLSDYTDDSDSSREVSPVLEKPVPEKSVPGYLRQTASFAKKGLTTKDTTPKSDSSTGTKVLSPSKKWGASSRVYKASQEKEKKEPSPPSDKDRDTPDPRKKKSWSRVSSSKTTTTTESSSAAKKGEDDTKTDPSFTSTSGSVIRGSHSRGKSDTGKLGTDGESGSTGRSSGNYKGGRVGVRKATDTSANGGDSSAKVSTGFRAKKRWDWTSKKTPSPDTQK